MVSFNEHGVSHLKQRELKQRLKTKYYFKDFKFNLVSASNVRRRDENLRALKQTRRRRQRERHLKM